MGGGPGMFSQHPTSLLSLTLRSSRPESMTWWTEGSEKEKSASQCVTTTFRVPASECSYTAKTAWPWPGCKGSTCSGGSGRVQCLTSLDKTSQHREIS